MAKKSYIEQKWRRGEGGELAETARRRLCAEKREGSLKLPVKTVLSAVEKLAGRRGQAPLHLHTYPPHHTTLQHCFHAHTREECCSSVCGRFCRPACGGLLSSPGGG